MMDYSRASDVPCGGLKFMCEIGGKMLCAVVNPYLSRNSSTGQLLDPLITKVLHQHSLHPVLLLCKCSSLEGIQNNYGHKNHSEAEIERFSTTRAMFFLGLPQEKILFTSETFLTGIRRLSCHFFSLAKLASERKWVLVKLSRLTLL